MKTILYIIIAIIIFGGSFLGISKASRSSHIITIQSTAANKSPEMLSQSVYIISQRLKAYYSNEFDIKVTPEKYQIQVALSQDKDLKTIEKLLTEKGALEFYETYSQKTIRELMKDNQEILSLMKNSDPGDSSARIGCLDKAQVAAIEGKISHMPHATLKLAWNNFFDTSEVCMYGLKLHANNKAVLLGTDIENCKLEHNYKENRDVLNLKFKIPAIPVWAEVTRNNVNKNIAMVLDDKVICAPTVRAEINGGYSQITGDFNHQEMLFITAIIQNGQLPMNFEVIR